VTREEHLKAIYIVGSQKLGKHTVLVMLCPGTECGGAQMFAHYNVGAVLAEANAHVDKMAELGAYEGAAIARGGRP
jgi:hypothetical protein